MAENIKMDLHFDVDVDAPLNVRTLSTLLAEGDKEANRITIELKRNGENMSVNGMTVTGSMTRADGYEIPLDGNVYGNAVTVELNEYCYAVGGPFGMWVQVKKGAMRRTVLLLAGYVQEKGHGEMIDTGMPLPSMDELLAHLETMRVVTEEAERAIEGAWEAGTEANKAAERADQAKEDADNAAGSAENAMKAAQESAEYVGGTTVSAHKLAAGSMPTASKSTVDGHMHVEFGLVTGDKGEPYMIKGRAYATVGELQEDITNPAEGDQYNVGTSAPYNVYRWTGSTWEDQGKLKGVQGDPGIGVKSVMQTTIASYDGGTNVWRMTLTDETTAEFLVKNGSRGSKGDSPVKGVDYFTAAERTEMVNEVLAALPTWTGGSY